MKSSITLSSTLVEFSVTDFNLTKNFYEKLGFSVVWEEKPKAMNGYLVMKKGTSVLCFFCGNEEVYNHPYFKKFPKSTKRGYGVEISYPVENIDIYYREVMKKIDRKFLFQPLRLQPWGLKDFRLVDPFGYFLRINEPSDFLNPVLLGDKDYRS